MIAVTSSPLLLPNHRAMGGHHVHPSIGIRNKYRRIQFGSEDNYDVSVLCQEPL